ncbi:MFS general substrate transporter [Cubamyces menziesii]|nr:MFS general substrate transporter [Cubamyces menziesii]
MVAMESDSSIEKRSVDETAKPHLATHDVDVAAELTAGKDFVLDPAEAARVRRKIDWHLMPLMCILYMMQFADKTTLGQSAVLGLLTSPKHHLTQSQFNWLGTIFYLFFLGFEWPQNLALQYLPVGKWMSINILIWAIALLCHAAATNFGGFFACRAFLGICEGAITPGFMIVTSMFYTRQEQTQRVGYWFLMNGAAIILLGLVAYGTLHIHSTVLEAWQWLMIITGIITFVVAILFWFFFPDSPANAWFLTPEERVIAIERIKVNQAGVENKHFKVEQFIECLKDPKTWLFFFFSAISNVTNSLSNQRQLIVAGFGFNPLQTTLLGCVDGVVEIIVIFCTVTSATYWKNGRAYSAVLAYCVAILGSILVNTLPSSDRVGLLFSYWISISSIAPFVVMLAWVGSTTAGHTKRLTTNAIVMIGYAVGNAAGPQYWEKKYQPRNHIPWLILSICWAVSALLLLATRFYLAWENARRDREGPDTRFDDVYVTEKLPDGSLVDKKVDKAFLDLTDMQNRDFRYVL